MRRALDLALQARGRTSPNPMVGCVIVKEGRIIGEGFHPYAGAAHAEVHALQAAGESAAGAELFVTLEPCNHTGRTPPCTEAIIRAKIRRVVAAIEDPNPLVSGQGAERLRQAGIRVDVGVLAKEAWQTNEAFIKVMTRGLPWVVYKSALTLDGKIATENGDSQWVSSDASRQAVQQMRNICDVIMVGSETVLHDDPALTCRLPGGKDPVRVVIDGSLRIQTDNRVLTYSAQAPCIIATTQASPPIRRALLNTLPNVEVWLYDTERYVPLKKLMQDLVARGWHNVLLEGGGRLAGQMLAEDLIDQVDFFVAPKLIGGQGPSPLSGFEVRRMSEARPLYHWQIDTSTGDLHIHAYLHIPHWVNRSEVN
ncbi:MAG: bifunctional diaminohydroxyphosphoribosylaminopyrimidine deaminase/5-amino-6-(5-phosphoribosylamino)uracil reductase RibD [Peptococcaceae bacterium]|nr:bifunctional diaminohydroxyphosphoribosylaminopyrimidine deaminase/5-amino-6-(5-phosphoribosylamino)uracil reductase RibD [Peptococcaceae bacterium]